MLAFFLFIALTNLVLGIILGYFYGDELIPRRLAKALATSEQPVHESTGHAKTTVASADPPVAPPTEPARPAAAVATPSPAATAAPPAEDLRPVKPTGSREISALDLADVMGELGITPSVPTEAAPTEAAAPAPKVEVKPVPTAPSPSAPEITFEALTGEPEPVAG